MKTVAETVKEHQALLREQRTQYIQEFNSAFAVALAQRVKAKVLNAPFLFGGFQVVLYYNGSYNLTFIDVTQMFYSDKVPTEYPLTVVVNGKTYGGEGEPISLPNQTLTVIADKLSHLLKEAYGFENIFVGSGLYGIMLEIRL